MTTGQRRYKAFFFLCGLAAFLSSALFTGCGKKKPEEKKSIGTIELPGGVTMTMVPVEAGTFKMSAGDWENDPDEILHQVTLTQDFYIAQTEVTQAQ